METKSLMWFIFPYYFLVSSVGQRLGQSREHEEYEDVNYGDNRKCTYTRKWFSDNLPGWRCHNVEQCISVDDICDGYKHCSDGSDEWNSTCCGTGFNGPGWPCQNGKQCISRQKVCDGDTNCPDGSDESSVTCCATLCSTDENICIPEGEVVAPTDDCRDCTDNVGDSGWRCNNGQCIPKKNICDKNNDCSDGSDESLPGCCAISCPNDESICLPAGHEVSPGDNCRDCTDKYGKQGWRCNSGHCVSKSFVCNGGHCSYMISESIENYPF